MKRRNPLRLAPAALALLGAALLVFPEAVAFTTLGHSLGLDQRDFRVYDNFADPSANDNTTPHPNWPGYTGVELAVWKSLAEWGSGLHGDGEGDPTQPGDLGSGGANYDPTWQGNATGIGASGDNVVSAIASCGGGVFTIIEYGSGGWRIRLCDNLVWDDGPGAPIAGALDIQAVLAHEFGHVLGLGHSSVAGSTMFPSLSGNGLSARSIEADDRAGLQFVYGAASPAKPRIDHALSNGSTITLLGAGFAATGNEVWFTELGANATGSPVAVSGLSSGSGGTRISLAVPASAGPGDVLVRVPGSTGAALSNAFPADPTACSTPFVYCTAKQNSQGCTSPISTSGTPSASAPSGFSIEASNLLNNVTGVLFYGTSGPAELPFQGGFLCVAPPVTRTTGQASGGSAPPTVDCSGTFSFDFNAWIVGGSDPSLVSGQDVWTQYWSRDPGFVPPDNTNLTDGAGFLICP